MFSAAKTSGPSGAYALTKSLRFRASASAYLNRTYSSSQTNAQKGTYSFWIKRGQLGVRQVFLGAYDGSATSGMSFEFTVTDNLLIQIPITTQSSPQIITNAVYRDASSWYHIFVSCDTTQSTASNRVLIYVNGVQVTSFSTATYPTQNGNTQFGYPNSYNKLGSWWASSSLYTDGYMADVYYIDGQALAPTSFGAFSATTGVWQPIKYTGTYGTNGFHLAFTNTTSTTTLGYDTSGNGNNWTTNNISLTAGSTYDSMNDVPNLASSTASNYCVLNPLDKGADITVVDGNLNVVAAVGWEGVRATFGMSSNKWYCEYTPTSGTYHIVSISTQPATGRYIDNAYGWGYQWDGTKVTNGSSSSYGSGWGVGDIIGIAFDANAGTLTFYKNGTSQGTAFTGLTSGPYFVGIGVYPSATGTYNFGQRAFSYTPPSGYLALNTYNLPTPSIVQDNLYMAVTTWVSAGGTETIVNTVNGVSCQPDFVWMKNRTISQNNYLMNSNSGVSKYLVSNLTQAEATDVPFVTSFNSNGFSLGTDGFTAGQTIVAWQWQANKGTNVTNTNGSITSTVSASTTAGFSIVTYTGNNTNGATVGHGLGVAPNVIIFKDRTNTSNWVWNDSSGTALFLNTTAGSTVGNLSHGYAAYANSTSTTFTLNSYGAGDMSYVNASGDSYVAYCFASIAGFSSFGSYTGNNSTTGPFVYLGFKPKYVMIKYAGSSGGTDWEIYDSARDTYNSVIHNLMADTANAEATSYSLSFLSNGFQITSLTSNLNDSGVTYIYLAFAENPFKYALAR